jgi:hypothetical protein
MTSVSRVKLKNAKCFQRKWHSRPLNKEFASMEIVLAAVQPSLLSQNQPGA